jgi:hypothetical protein
MREVWEPFNAEAVPDFYRRDVIGHHRKQQLTYDDVVNRLASDRTRFGSPVCDIQDIVAAEDKFAIRFAYTAIILSTGQDVSTEVIYFYHLKDGRVAGFQDKGLFTSSSTAPGSKSTAPASGWKKSTAPGRGEDGESCIWRWTPTAARS